MRIKKYQQQT
jgi:CRP-like cAMP-binding protein